MAERAVWRPPWYLWSLGGLGALAMIHHSAPWLLHGHWLLVVAIALIALLLLVLALWELPPAVMLCSAIVLAVLSGNWDELGIPGIPIDRIMLAGVVLALLLRAPGTARLPHLRIRGVHLLMALTVAYVAVSAVLAGTLSSENGFLSLLDEVGAVPYLMFLLAPVVFSGARERNMLLATLVCLGAYVGLTAVFETVGPRGLVFPRYIVGTDALKPFQQAGGPFGAPITEGFACFSCGVAAAIAFHQWRGRRRYLAAAVIPLSAFGAFLTLERGVWIAAAAGIVAVGLAVPDLRRWLAPAAATCVLLIGGALVISPALAGNTSARTSDQTSIWDRQNQTATALRMIATKPLFGFGWHNYANVSLPYFRQPGGYPMTGFSTSDNPLPLHDSYLSFAVELGFVGAMLWLASLLWGVGGAIFRRGSAALRPWKAGLLAIGVFYCVLAAFDPLQQPFTALLLWVWAGLVVPANVTRPPPSTPDVRSAPSDQMPATVS